MEYRQRGLSRKYILEQCDASLKRLGLGYIDLYQAHRYNPTVPLVETLMAFDHLVKQGKILYSTVIWQNSDSNLQESTLYDCYLREEIVNGW